MPTFWYLHVIFLMLPPQSQMHKEAANYHSNEAFFFSLLRSCFQMNYLFGSSKITKILYKELWHKLDTVSSLCSQPITQYSVLTPAVLPGPHILDILWCQHLWSDIVVSKNQVVLCIWLTIFYFNQCPNVVNFYAIIKSIPVHLTHTDLALVLRLQDALTSSSNTPM